MFSEEKETFSEEKTNGFHTARARARGYGRSQPQADSAGARTRQGTAAQTSGLEPALGAMLTGTRARGRTQAHAHSLEAVSPSSSQTLFLSFTSSLSRVPAHTYACYGALSLRPIARPLAPLHTHLARAALRTSKRSGEKE